MRRSHRNEDDLQSDEEKPRYLLPAGCSDLIDVFIKQKPIKKQMFMFDHGNLLELLHDLNPESISPGLPALPDYISRLLGSSDLFLSLSVFAYSVRGFGLLRQGPLTLLSISTSVNESSEFENSVRALCGRYSLPPAKEYISNSNYTLTSIYKLPQPADTVTAICSELLTVCYGVHPDETLHFILTKQHDHTPQ